MYVNVDVLPILIFPRVTVGKVSSCTCVNLCIVNLNIYNLHRHRLEVLVVRLHANIFGYIKQAAVSVC